MFFVSIRMRQPIVDKISSDNVTSLMQGTFSMTHLSSTISAASNIGNAAFFAPLTSIVPRSGFAPFMIIFSITTVP